MQFGEVPCNSCVILASTSLLICDEHFIHCNVMGYCVTVVEDSEFTDERKKGDAC